MDKPMPDLKCPTQIPVLVGAAKGRRCKLVFTAANWDLDTKEKGQIALKSFEWLKESAQPPVARPERAAKQKGP